MMSRGPKGQTRLEHNISETAGDFIFLLTIVNY